MKRKPSLLALASTLAIGVAGVTSPAYALDVTIEDIMNDQATVGDIVSYGLGPKAQRYSPLDALNKDNVKNLYPVWSFSFGGEKQRGQESQPLIKDGVMYVTGSYSRMWAIDIATGEELWQYDARLPEGILPCCDVVNRGAAILGDKVFFGTLDAKIVALDAATGKVIWRKKIGDYEAGYSYTAAPLIVPTDAHGPLILTGNSGGEFGIVGAVEARHPDTGELIWRRPTVEGHMGQLKGQDSTMTGTLNESWAGDQWKNGGVEWAFQTTPHDGWDFDGVNEFISFDMEKDGEVIKAGATADRNGFFYVLDRTNGEFISASPFVQNITWAKGIDENGRPIWDPENRPGNPVESADGKKGKSIFAIPSFLGGKNWMPMAYSQNTNHFYIPSNEWGMDLWNEPVTYKKGAAYMGAGFTIKPIFDDYIGSLKAMDPVSGEVKWEYKNKAPLWGGVLTTAGGLVFTGTPEGHLKAFDDETGEELWKFQTGTGIVSSPITWEQDGEQYVAIVTGWGGAVPLWGGEVAKVVNYLNQGGSVWVFKIPEGLASR